jgi:predicted DNA-binding transcriptional regulator YafY
MPEKVKPLLRRILAIHRALLKGGTVNCNTLQGLPEFETYSTKTIQRDIDYLRDEWKAPIEYDGRKKSFVYTKKADLLPAVPVDEGDFFAIMIAEKVLEQYENTPLFAQLQRTFDKIRIFLPERIMVSPSALQAKYTFLFPPAARLDPEVWETVSRGVVENRRLRIDHTTAGASRPKTREVDPYQIVNHDGAWCVIGHCHTKNAIRTFAVSRISKADQVDQEVRFSLAALRASSCTCRRSVLGERTSTPFPQERIQRLTSRRALTFKVRSTDPSRCCLTFCVGCHSRSTT